MTNKQIHDKAFSLRSELFELIGKFKDLHSAALKIAIPDDDASLDALLEEQGQIDAAACDLARVYNSLPWVFIAAAGE